MDPLHSVTLGDVPREHRRIFPDRVALVDGTTRLTWPELDDRVNRLADALRTAGMGPGGRIMWLGQNSFRVVELLLAAAKLGAMLCPANWRQTADELAWVLDDFDPEVVVWQSEEIGDAARGARERHARGLWLEHDGEGMGSYEAFLVGGSPVDVDIDVDPESAVLVIYTAAFSGRPNGALLSHGNLLTSALVNAYYFDLDDDYVFLNCSPMFHWASWTYILPTLMLGGRNVTIRRMDAEELCRVIEAEGCTGAFIPPVTISQINELNKDGKYDLRSLRIGFHAEMWTSGMTSANHSRTAVWSGGYGQTEVAGRCLMQAVGKGGKGFHGRTPPLSAVRLLDDAGGEVPDGEVGEISVRGFLVCRGYWNRPELNVRRTGHGWWRTNDLGRREEDGSVTFVGPKTQMIKCGEENIYPAEVEAALESHPAVKEAAIIGVADPKWVQSVKAIVVLADGASLSAEELVAYCKTRIASYKKPRAVVFTPALLRIDGAKDYAALDAAFGGGGYPGELLY